MGHPLSQGNQPDNPPPDLKPVAGARQWKDLPIPAAEAFERALNMMLSDPNDKWSRAAAIQAVVDIACAAIGNTAKIGRPKKSKLTTSAVDLKLESVKSS